MLIKINNLKKYFQSRETSEGSKWIKAVDNVDLEIRKVMRFYATYNQTNRTSKDKLFSHESLMVPDDEKVEDPGLFDKYENREITINNPVPVSSKQVDLFDKQTSEIQISNY